MYICIYICIYTCEHILILILVSISAYRSRILQYMCILLCEHSYVHVHAFAYVIALVERLVSYVYVLAADSEAYSQAWGVFADTAILDISR